jgi:replicative DNA helicase
MNGPDVRAPYAPSLAPQRGESALRVPPQAVEVEKHVLGAMLLDPEAISVALEHLTAEDFYLEKHRLIYEAILALFEKGAPTDVLSLAEALRRAKAFEKAGGEPALLEISADVVSSASVEEHCRIVKEKAMLRRLIGSATKMLEQAYDTSQDPAEIMDQAEGDIFAISASNIKEGFQPIRTILNETFKLIESYGKGEVVGVPSGYKDLDALTGGFQKTDLIILAARPGMGKTSLALGVLANAAIDHRRTVAFFSLEMGREQLVQRVLCAQARVNMHQLRNGKLPRSELGKLGIAVGPISESKIFIDDHPSLNILELRAKCRRLKAQQGLDIVIIDYLQLMQGVGRQENRQQEISQISRGLKGLAKELQIPVIALSQLSRAVEQRGGEGEPKLSDLRESGAIEQDADIVMFLYREFKDPKTAGADAGFEPDRNKTKLLVAKQRNGPTGDLFLTFRPEYASYESYSGREEGGFGGGGGYGGGNGGGGRGGSPF